MKGFFDSFNIEGSDGFEKRSLSDEELDRGVDPIDDADDNQEDDQDVSDIDKMKYSDDPEDDKDVDNKDTSKTKTVEDKADNDNDDDSFSFAPVVETLAEEGILFYDEEKEYEDSEEGFKEIIKDTVNKRWEEELSHLSDDARRLLEIAKNGGDLKEAFETLNGFSYSEVDLEDEDNQTELIRDQYKLMGWEDEDIEAKIVALEDSGTKAVEAKVAQKYLVKHETKQKEEYIKSIEDKRKQEELNRVEALKELEKDIFSTKEIGSMKLDKEKQKGFFEYLTKPVTKNGETQAMINGKDRERQKMLAYLDYINFDFSMIEKQAETKVTKSLKKALSNFNDSNAKRTGTGSRQGQVTKEVTRIPRGVWDSNRDVD